MKLLLIATLHSWIFRRSVHVLKPSSESSKIESHNNKHLYKQLFPWRKLDEFSSYLASQIVYNKDGLIAINKPYGVKIYRSQNRGKSVENSGYLNLLASQEDFPYSVEDTLLYIKEHLNLSKLSVIKATERYSSGLVLLSANDEVFEQVEKAFGRAKCMNRPHLIYRTITHGCPVVDNRKEKVGLKFIQIEDKDEKQPIIVTNFSRNDALKKRQRTINVEYRTIVQEQESQCSLLEIRASSTASHFLRIYSASRAASILGDPFYSSRIQQMLGKPINVNPNNMVAFNIKPLPINISKKLELPNNVAGHLLIPSMLHLHSIFLPYFLKKEHLVIEAKPPSHFEWTCQRLNLCPLSTEDNFKETT